MAEMDARQKKKRKLKPSTESRMKIIDDDITVNHLLPSNLENTLEEDVGDNEPTVVGFIDERPEHIKRLEEYQDSSRWKKFRQHHKNDKTRHDSDSDQSVEGNRHDSDSDQSLPRRRRHDSDLDQSPPRRGRHDSDSDQSPQRRHRHDSGPDQSPPRKRRYNSDSDQSPPRRKKTSDIQSNSRRKSDKKNMRHDSDSDQSPLRKGGHDSDSDQLPPRKGRRDSDSGQFPPRSHGHSNKSPPRRHKQSISDKDSVKQRRKSRFDNPDSDSSPPRKRRTSPDESSVKNKGHGSQKATKTLSGAKAGLSSAREMRQEAEKIRKREDDAFRKADAEALGRNAKTVFRDKEGKRRNLASEKVKEEEEEKRKAAREQKYAEWGKGLKQQEESVDRLAASLHEASKPLARYRDDEDLDKMLKDQEREGDPMALFMKKKKKTNPNIKEKPKYKGPAPPPNRFHLMPGYRWDGVDRSNGFEKQLFQKIADKRATDKMAYKWGVEDM